MFEHRLLPLSIVLAASMAAASAAPQHATPGPDSIVPAHWQGYARSPQHDATSSGFADPLQRIRWQTPVDLQPQYSGTALLIHYGSPLVTAGGLVIVTVKVGKFDGFRVEGRRQSDGALLWTQDTDYSLPSHDWTPSCGPTLTPEGKLIIPGSGGTVYRRERPDARNSTVSQMAFYGMPNYLAGPSLYDTAVKICTPITTDSEGTIYFGFVVNGFTPISLASGLARLDRTGKGTWIAAGDAAQDTNMKKVAYNCAPALSHDGSTVYVAVNNKSGSGAGSGYLLGLDRRTLAPKYRVKLKDVANTSSDAFVNDDGTACPTVGPDGDVYYGVLERPTGSNHLRGWMLHFDATLAQTKIPGAFGWDDTSSIVPRDAVPSYVGASPYLVLTKYNNYAGGGGDGVNKVAVLDPFVSMTDPISGQTVMKEVITIAGPTPDPDHRDSSHPNAVREWCINTAAVDPTTRSAIVNNEDGIVYRWDFVTNTLSQKIPLTPGIGEAYTPTIIGSDGTSFAINNAILFALGP